VTSGEPFSISVKARDLQHLHEDRREKMKLHTALGALVAVLLVAPGCGNQDDGTSQPGKTGGQSGSGSGGKGGSGGNGSGGNASGGSGGNASGGSGGNASGGSGGNGSGGSGGNASGGSGGNASGGSGGNASGGSGGNGSGGSKTGGTTGSGGGASGGSGGNGSGGSGGNASGGSGGNNPDAGVGSNGTGGSTVPDAGRDGVVRTGGTTGAGGAGSGGATGTGGATGKGGTAGTGGAGGKNICTFASGLNVAWVNFANDVPNPDITTFSKIFKDTHDNGGRVVRWWFHTNGTVTPGYNSDGTVKTIAQSHIDGVKGILAAANSAGIAVNISLWSFDMAQDNAGNTATQNQALLTTDSLRQSYVDNYLTALVTALKGTPGLYSYEIFNEPEGMETTGWATKFKIDKSYIQKAVNWWAAGIHAADSTVPVTSGAQTMDSCSGVSGKRNDYSDSALTSVGGKATGTLDFYEVHYYQVNGSSDDVFSYPRSYWNLTDKKLVIGEFAAYATDSSPVAVNDTYTYLFSNGYDGAWAWSYTEGNSNYKWPSMQTPMQNLYTAQKATIDACP
jgi:hypothetical protein